MWGRKYSRKPFHASGPAVAKLLSSKLPYVGLYTWNDAYPVGVRCWSEQTATIVGDEIDIVS